MMKHIATLVFAAILAAAASAQEEAFSTGPLIEDFGAVASVEDARLSPETELKVAFDVAKAAAPGTVNRYLESSARFLNMHVAAGVPAENIEIAIVVHGGAAMDLVTDARYGGENANADLVAALIAAGVSIELCGQTAAYRGLTEGDLLPGVRLSLSAMTSHALLQQDGYTLNPF